MRRVVEDGSPRTELIWYHRPDVAGPKLSDFKKLDIPEAMAEDMKELLSLTAGVRGEVAKQRHLFLVGQTRVHVDDVKDLGHFMELEVCLREEQTLEEGQKIADELREALEIPESDMLTGAYMDMLQKK